MRKLFSAIMGLVTALGIASAGAQTYPSRAITLIAILHHVSDYDEARSIVNRLVEGMPSGSYLVMSHSTNAIYGAVSDEAVGQWNKFGKPPVPLRSPEQIAGLLDGLEVIEPGVVATELFGHQQESTQQHYRKLFAGVEPLHTEDIAEATAYIVTNPRRVAVNEIVIRPTDQR